MCKEGRNSLVAQVLIGACHMQTYANKKSCIHMNLRAHTRNEARSPEKRAFLDSSHDQSGERFTDAEEHSGLGRARNMKVCVVVSESRMLEHILLVNSWTSRCPLTSFIPVFPSFLPSTQNFYRKERGGVQIEKVFILLSTN